MDLPLPTSTGSNTRRSPATAQDLNNRQVLITQLYWHEDRDLPEVMSIMEAQHSFKSTQYKGAFSRWKLKKNLTRNDLRHINRIQRRRQEHEDKATRFELYSRPLPEQKVERSNQRHATDSYTSNGSIGTPGYISYETPSVYHSVPSTPMSYHSVPTTPMSLDFATPREYLHGDGDISWEASPAYTHSSPEASMQSWAEAGTAEVPEARAESALDNARHKSPAVRSRHSTNDKDSSSGEEASDDNFYPEVYAVSPVFSCAAGCLLSMKLWRQTLLESRWNQRSNDLALRLSEVDLRSWVWIRSPRVAHFEDLLLQFGSPSVVYACDSILDLLGRKAHTPRSKTLGFVLQQLNGLTANDHGSCKHVDDLNISLVSSRSVSYQAEHVSDLRSHFWLFAPGWDPAAPRPALQSKWRQLAEYVFYKDYNETTADYALSLLEPGLDHSTATTLAFEGCMIRERIAWLEWFCDVKPTILTVNLMNNGFAHHFDSKRDWVCPIHWDGCVYRPLYYSVGFCDVSVTKTLLKRGASLHDKGSFDSCSPLGIAIRLNRIDQVGALLSGGADPRAPCCGPLTPFELACLLKRKEIFVLLGLEFRSLTSYHNNYV